MTIPSEHCEAKKHGYRQTQDGVVVSFVLHPSEIPDGLALAPLGTRYMLALVQIGDDEQPVVAPQKPAESKKALRAPRPFKTLPRSQQAALACGDVAFQAWIVSTANSPLRATDTAAAHLIRERLGIKSRAELDEGAPQWVSATADRWDALYARYESETRRVAEER